MIFGVYNVVNVVGVFVILVELGWDLGVVLCVFEIF